MEIWIEQSGESLRLPVNPPGFEITQESNNTTINVNKIGEVSLIGKKKLKTISIASFFPSKKYSFVQYLDFPPPNKCIQLVENWIDAPVKLTITGSKICMWCTIDSFTYAEQDGTGDIYYTISLKEYKQLRDPTKKNGGAPTVPKNSKRIIKPKGTRQTKAVKNTTYTVKKGDTLWAIAKRLTGCGANYRAIANQNNISNPNKIKIGMELIIKT